MDIKAEAEQLRKGLRNIERGPRIGNETVGQSYDRIKIEQNDLILQSYERIAKEAWDECSNTWSCLEDAATSMTDLEYHENFKDYWKELTDK